MVYLLKREAMKKCWLKAKFIKRLKNEIPDG